MTVVLTDERKLQAEQIAQAILRLVRDEGWDPYTTLAAITLANMALTLRGHPDLESGLLRLADNNPDMQWAFGFAKYSPVVALLKEIEAGAVLPEEQARRDAAKRPA